MTASLSRTSFNSTTSTRQSNSGLRIFVLVLIVIAIVVACWYALGPAKANDEDSALTWTAQKSDLRITVTERGTLKSQNTVNGVCEVEGYENKIIFIAEEGSTVEKDQAVVRIDSAQIDKEIAEEKMEVEQATGSVETKLQDVEVARNEGESEIAAADLELTLAKLDLEKYEQGDYQVELSDLQGKIALAAVELEKATEALQNTEVLVKKGFREPEQIRTAEQSVESARFSLERDQRALEVLKKFDFKRKITEFKANASEAERKLDRAKANADAKLKKAKNEHKSAIAQLKLQQADLKEAETQKSRCEIKATQAGVVAYANEDWWPESRRIREGASVYERQVVFFIPDMKLLQVEVKIHESEVKRVAADQKAIIRVDAFANMSFTGTVKSVAQLSKSERFFGGGVKEYPAVITLDDMPSVELRPGMTAEVEILVDSLSQVVTIPVQAIAEHGRRHYVYVEADGAVERREVEIGQSNNRVIEVTSGIIKGDVVRLDARSRAAKEFKDDDGATESDALKSLEAESKQATEDSKKEADSTDADAKETAETETANETAEKDTGVDETEQPEQAKPESENSLDDNAAKNVDKEESPESEADSKDLPAADQTGDEKESASLQQKG